MKRRPAFTLIELLVVIAIIALLLSVIIPSINKAKQIAATAVCLSNISQMGKGYYMYAEENAGFVTDGKPCPVANPTLADKKTAYWTTTVNGRSWRTLCFVADPMDEDGNFSHKNVEDEIRGLRAGGLWPYLQSPDVYHCPVDTRWRRPPENPARVDQHAIGGWRSYSIGAVLSAGGYGETSSGENKAVVLKYNGISSPGDKIVFLEEKDGDGVNDNFWDLNLIQPQWRDPVSIGHNGYSTFAFADGHADRYKWTDENMIKMSEEGSKNQPADTRSDDYQWFKRAYIPGLMRP